MRKNIACLFGLTLLVFAISIGCGDDNNPGTPQTGTITINPEPNDINAPWYLSGPGEYNHSGAGDATLENMPVGDYTIDWGVVVDWDAPGSETQAVVTDATVIFDATYLDTFPDTEQRLMERFLTAYDHMNIDEYRRALHADFVFVFADGSPVAPTNGIFTRVEDLLSTTNMFNGVQGLSPDGQPIPAVRDIEFQQLVRLTDWEVVPETDLYFPGAILARYDVRVVFYLNTEDVNTITVDSQQLFYLQSIDDEQDGGSSRTRFYMIGQQDLSNWRSDFINNLNLTSQYNWGVVKDLYF